LNTSRIVITAPLLHAPHHRLSEITVLKNVNGSSRAEDENIRNAKNS
jgi:hypothetical protein